jgi:AraC-like DNA-binding protein
MVTRANQTAPTSSAALCVRAVREELSPVFSTLWTRTSCSPLVEFSRIPDGCADLIWCDGTIYVYGPDLSRAAIALASTAPLVGLRFRAGAAAKWLGVGAPEIVGVGLPLEFFGSGRAHDLARSLGTRDESQALAVRLEEALIPTVSDATVLERPCIDTVLELLEREHAKGGFLNALRRAYDLSERSVRRETMRVFGYGPKALERIYRVQRFLRFARSPRPAKLAWLASACGFSDQAHMTREVRAIAGLTPNEAVRFARSPDASSPAELRLSVSFKTSP